MFPNSTTCSGKNSLKTDFFNYIFQSENIKWKHVIPILDGKIGPTIQVICAHASCYKNNSLRVLGWVNQNYMTNLQFIFLGNFLLKFKVLHTTHSETKTTTKIYIKQYCMLELVLALLFCNRDHHVHLCYRVWYPA